MLDTVFALLIVGFSISLAFLIRDVKALDKEIAELRDKHEFLERRLEYHKNLLHSLMSIVNDLKNQICAADTELEDEEGQ